MASKKNNAAKPAEAEKVNEYISKLSHPLKTEIEAVRTIIKNANIKIAERIKWNAPSYHVNGADLVTFNPRATKHVHLRMTYFTDMKEIKSKANELKKVIDELVKSI